MDTPPQLSSRETTGRGCIIAFIASTAAFDILIKGASLIVGRLHISSIVGTLLTAVLLIYLWRGAAVAWWILAVCNLLALIFGVALAARMPLWFAVGSIGLLSALFVLLVIPQSRDFLAVQRAKRA